MDLLYYGFPLIMYIIEVLIYMNDSPSKDVENN